MSYSKIFVILKDFGVIFILFNVRKLGQYYLLDFARFLCVLRNVPYPEDYRHRLVAVVDKLCLINMCDLKGVTPIFASFCLFTWATCLFGCREMNIETKRADLYSTW